MLLFQPINPQPFNFTKWEKKLPVEVKITRSGTLIL